MTISNRLAAAVAFVASAAALTYLAHKRSNATRRSEIKTVADLKGNSEARGSDVVSLYRRRLHQEGDERKKRTFIVTGANSGLGRQVALLLGKAGGDVIIAIRNVDAGKEVVHEIMSGAAGGARGTAECMYLDLSSLASVRKFARDIAMRGKTIHGLCNNAGVYGIAGKTVDGFQTCWQVNCMAPALLTELLLPVTSNDFRVVNVSSEMNRLISNVHGWCPPTTSGSGMFDYALSKVCQVLHAHELTIRFTKESNSNEMENNPTSTNRRAFAVEPGLVQTNVMRASSAFVRRVYYTIFSPILRSPDEGTATILFCLLADPEDLDEESRTGSSPHPKFYYAICAEKVPSHCSLNLDEVESLGALFSSIWGDE